MADLLPTVGTFSYNGFTFNNKTRTVARGKPLYDQADRTVVATVFTITAITVIQSATGTGSTITDAIQRLSKAGQSLVYSSQGFADLSINVAGVRDVMWGPKPRVIDCRPLGSSQAWELVWSCEVAIPMCTNAQYAFAVMAFNYEVDFSIDADGYTTRVISGYLEIPLTRLGGGSAVIDSADSYWERIQPALLPGFQRKDRSRRLSADKRRLDFTIVDEQIPGGGFPPGITSFEGSHVTANEANNWVRFNSTISATYTVAPGTPRSVAAAAFYQLLLDRAKLSKEKGRIFHGFSATEGLGTNRKISFSCSYAFTSNIANCLADSGFWRPVPDTEWDKWIASEGVRQSQSARGHAGLRFFSHDDAIIDLCAGTISALKRGGRPEENKLRRVDAPRIETKLKAEQSWIRYRVKLIVENRPSTTRLKYLPIDEQPSNSGMGAMEQSLAKLTNTTTGTWGSRNLSPSAIAKSTSSGKIASESGITPDTIQVRAAPTYRVILEGQAIRAGFGIPLPKLITVAGLNASSVEPATQKATGDMLVANWGGTPIYARMFRLEYDLTEPPDNATVGVPGNPALQIER